MSAERSEPVGTQTEHNQGQPHEAGDQGHCAQKGSNGLPLCCHHLGVPSAFLNKGLHPHFVPDPANYVASPLRSTEPGT